MQYKELLRIYGEPKDHSLPTTVNFICWVGTSVQVLTINMPRPA